MDHENRKRLKWIKVYEQIRNAGITCLRCRDFQTDPQEVVATLPV